MRAVLLIAATLSLAPAAAAQAEIVHLQGGVAQYIVRSDPLKLDPKKLKPAPMAVVRRPIPSGVQMLRDAMKAGESGATAVSRDGPVSPPEYGTSNQPYTTSEAPSGYEKRQPYPGVGQFLYADNSGIHTCSGALIKRGLIVTAARCVAPFGSNAYYPGFGYWAAVVDGASPYGLWNVNNVFVLDAWLDGSDACTASGQICRNDIAVATVTEALELGGYPGDVTGWFNYTYNPAAFVNGQTQVAQLGYAFDLKSLKRTDSTAVIVPSLPNNAVIGSLLTDGSQGGPWVINLGNRPRLNGTSYGEFSKPNVVVGVTSWSGGVSSPAEQRAGASLFTNKNIKILVEKACSVAPNAC